MRYQRSDVLLRKIINLIPIHLYWKDTDFRYLGCNMRQALSLGLKSPDEIIGKTDYDLSPKSIADKLRDVDCRVSNTGEPIEVEEVVLTPQGKKSVVLSQKIPLYYDCGGFIGIAGISIDITDRKKMEASLKQAKEKADEFNQLKSQFISNMQHDLRSPTSSVIQASVLKIKPANEYFPPMEIAAYKHC